MLRERKGNGKGSFKNFLELCPFAVTHQTLCKQERKATSALGLSSEVLD